MKKLFLLFALASFVVAHADNEYLGLYMGGNKIGYSSYNSHPETLNGERVVRSDSKTVMSAGLLGTAMQMTIDGTTWTSTKGKTLKMMFIQSSAGRVQKVVATFGAAIVQVDIDSQGQKTHKSLPIPKDGVIVDDPLELVVGGKAKAGKAYSVYTLDPTTVSFIKNEVVLVGRKQTKVKGKSVSGTLVQIIDPRMTMDVFVDAKGGLIKVDGPMGIEMIPESRKEALSNSNPGYAPSADLAYTTSIRPNKTIENPETLTGLTLRITGRDLANLPSDAHQTVKKDGTAWIIDVHPPKLSVDTPTTIAEAGQEKPDWLKPSLDIPSDNENFKNLSAKILNGETKVVPAAVAIKAYVNETMHPNAGIGVLRDASEVLRSKEGVCRDYAILTTTLMRAAGIPARLASGVVNWQGDFYYHAWAEIWDGSHWIGIDSTVPQTQMSAAHLKLADGNVEQAFKFAILDKVRIEVLDVRHK